MHLSSPHARHTPFPLHSYLFDQPNNIWWDRFTVIMYCLYNFYICICLVLLHFCNVVYGCLCCFCYWLLAQHVSKQILKWTESNLIISGPGLISILGGCNGVSIPGGTKTIYFSSLLPYRIRGPSILPCKRYRRPFPPRAKATDHEANHSLLSSVDVKNKWICTSASPYALIA